MSSNASLIVNGSGPFRPPRKIDGTRLVKYQPLKAIPKDEFLTAIILPPHPNQESIQSLFPAKLSIPLEMEVANSIFMKQVPVKQNFYRLGENPLLAPNEPSVYAPLTFFRGPRNPSLLKRKLSKWKFPQGISYSFLKRKERRDRERLAVKERLAIVSSLLEKKNAKLRWKFEIKANIEKKERMRVVRREHLEMRGVKKPLMDCALDSCARKEIERKRPFMPREEIKSPSDLSPGRSRSPITFC